MVGGSLTRTAILAAACLVPLAGAAQAAELKIISAGAVRGVIAAMIEDYARRTGHTFDFTVGSTGQLREVIASGKPADLIIVSASTMGELEKTGKITPGSRVDLGRVGLGVVVREGVAAPDVAYTEPKRGGVSYLHLMKITDAFGIADSVAQKGVHATGGNDAVAKVAAGEAELAVVLVSEIHHKGARLVALLPEALQLWTVYAAAVPAASAEPEHARAFIAALVSPAMRSHWTAAGWEPAK
jgi:molybdate transport system substrate-binding protein